MLITSFSSECDLLVSPCLKLYMLSKASGGACPAMISATRATLLVREGREGGRPGGGQRFSQWTLAFLPSGHLSSTPGALGSAH
jgi:hypothetical protein